MVHFGMGVPCTRDDLVSSDAYDTVWRSEPDDVDRTPPPTGTSPSGIHGARASITSAIDSYRLCACFAIILAMTSDNSFGNVLSTAESGGASRIWCCISFWVVFPVNGGCRVTRA